MQIGLRHFPTALLFALGAVAFDGCGNEPVGPEREAVEPEPTRPPAVSISPGPRALFFVNRAKFEEPDWPERYRVYGLFVCDPVLDPAEIAAMRTDFPDAMLLTYANAQSVRIAMHEEPYWRALTDAFDSSLCIRDLQTGSVVRLEDDVPAFVHGPEAAEALAAFHRDVTMQLGTDGIYMDQVTVGYPEWKRVRLGQLAEGFDIDNDGVADGVAGLDATYAAWKPHFLQRLRDEIGDEAILIGNSNGPLGHPALNGMSIENVYLRFTIEEARAWVTEQVWVSRLPRVNVLWAFNGITWAPSEQLARQLPSTHVGDLDPRYLDPDRESRDWDD
jgi:hypothetical protein